jgi:hypothetical protein
MRLPRAVLLVAGTSGQLQLWLRWRLRLLMVLLVLLLVLLLLLMLLPGLRLLLRRRRLNLRERVAWCRPAAPLLELCLGLLPFYAAAQPPASADGRRSQARWSIACRHAPRFSLSSRACAAAAAWALCLASTCCRFCSACVAKAPVSRQAKQRARRRRRVRKA